jgi:hypothetical protein
MITLTMKKEVSVIAGDPLEVARYVFFFLH